MPGHYIVIVVGLFVINLALIAWAITDLLARENVKYLPKAAWMAIVAVIFFGSILYLLTGRGDDLKKA